MSIKSLVSALAVLLLLPTKVMGVDSPTLTMHVIPRISKDDVSLLFCLRYDGQDSIEAALSSLPGIQRHFTIAIDAQRFPDYDNPGRKPCGSLQDVISIDDPGTGWRRVASGQEFYEDIHLSELYKGVENVLGQCELIVNWSYKMYTQDKVRFPRMAGSVVIPSNRRPVMPPDISVRGEKWKYDGGGH